MSHLTENLGSIVASQGLPVLETVLGMTNFPQSRLILKPMFKTGFSQLCSYHSSSPHPLTLHYKKKWNMTFPTDATCFAFNTVSYTSITIGQSWFNTNSEHAVTTRLRFNAVTSQVRYTVISNLILRWKTHIKL